MALNKNAKKWVAALRSGKYKQSKKFLHVKEEGFCCLGVACDLYAKKHKDLKVEVRSSTPDQHVYLYDSQTGALPNIVKEWLGLATNTGSVPSGTTLSELNDDHDWTFNMIADYVESEPKGLFKPNRESE